MHVRQFIELKL